MVTHSSILAWRIPWTEELGRGVNPMDRGAWGGLPSMGLQRVGHDWGTKQQQ